MRIMNRTTPDDLRFQPLVYHPHVLTGPKGEDLLV